MERRLGERGDLLAAIDFAQAVDPVTHPDGFRLA